MQNQEVPGKLLVIAQSARMLAQMAVVAGYRPVAIDCFGDEDTAELADESVKVASLALSEVRPVLEAMRSIHGLNYVVYGSGFERHTETLTYLEKNWNLLGCSAEAFKTFQDKPKFFARLAELAVPHPETVFAPPIDGGDWLLKPMRGEGGMAISNYRRDSAIPDRSWYWQRYLPGQAMSCTFLAGPAGFRLLGFNRQFSVEIDERHPFAFAGVVSHAELTEFNRKSLLETIRKLIVIYPLRGLCSLDFVLVNGECYILEINARIPASAQLYGDSAFSLHIRACRGHLDDYAPVRSKGYRIVYARKALTIPDGLKWPEWISDRPQAGALVGMGEPICSIIAAGKDAEQVEERLRRQQDYVEKFLNIGL